MQTFRGAECLAAEEFYTSITLTMGIYSKKSISVGPFRYSLSKSGVGLSVGVKGLRVGTGPRGNYVRMGRGGIYYHKALPSVKNSGRANSEETVHEFRPETFPASPTHGPMQEIESGCVTAMLPSNSLELLEEINNKRKKKRYWPFVLITGALISFFLLYPVIGLFVTIGLTLVTSYYDRLRKTVVLFYELEPDAAQSYEELIEIMDRMASCHKLWHIESEGVVYNKKYHAGANKIINRFPSQISNDAPSFLKTNITVPMLGVGNQALYFFPDCILVYESKKVGAVSYQDLDIHTFTENFIEEEKVPKDSKIVGYTWQYVNKNGYPDKRFASNPRLPKVEYEYVHFRSNSGLNEQICLSRVGASTQLASTINHLNFSKSRRPRSRVRMPR